MNWNLAQAVFEQSARTPDRLALYADGIELSYGELSVRAARLAGALRARGTGRGSRVGILGSRSLIAVEAVLAVTWAGAAFVPLGVRWPQARLRSVLALARLDALIVDDAGLACLTAPVAAEAGALVVPSSEAARALAPAAAPWVLSLDALDAGAMAQPATLAADDLAYLVFTSGTTGVPKGVLVATASVNAYLDALAPRKAMAPHDRASQFTELTFDPSVGEIFLPWRAGASLHVVPALSHVSPARFIRERKLTVWGSAPAAIAWMRATRSLQPQSLPGLRYSSFGGEPLPLASVRAWQAAAPNSVVDNLYGPTEATVDCAGQRVEPGATPSVTPGRGVLAIGVAHPGTRLRVLGPDLRPVAVGEKGELAIAGKQLTLGYLDAPRLTAERFPLIDGERWYLTGDIAMQDARGDFHHLGRIDNQVKIHGHRVELEDIEAHVRALAGAEQVAAVAWPVEDGVARSIVCFVANAAVAPERIRELLRQELPPHMVPSAIYALEALPRNANGKLNRQALIERMGTHTMAPRIDS
ncbi:MAG: amino acid adenylation domain-containing protein [Burkholderiales bacterium]|nr:amino acid adenylation domain-containing protein [Burkholderiales bacterium]